MHANDAKCYKMRGNRSGLVFSLMFFALVGEMDQVLPTNHRAHYGKTKANESYFRNGVEMRSNKAVVFSL